MADPHVEAFAQAFVMKDKQKRFVQLVESACAEKATARMLEKLGEYLDHALGTELDQRYSRELGHHEDVGFQTKSELPEAIANVITDDPNQDCYIISAVHPMRFRHARLQEAMAATRTGDTITGGDGTIYSCVPGKLALYEPEVGFRVLCKRD